MDEEKMNTTQVQSSEVTLDSVTLPQQTTLLTQIQSRLRSKAAWGTTIGLVLFVLKVYCKIEIPRSDDLVTLIFAELLALGIWNNPTNPKGY